MTGERTTTTTASSTLPQVVLKMPLTIFPPGAAQACSGVITRIKTTRTRPIHNHDFFIGIRSFPATRLRGDPAKFLPEKRTVGKSDKRYAGPFLPACMSLRLQAEFPNPAFVNA